jgi:hypothetical protein
MAGKSSSPVVTGRHPAPPDVTRPDPASAEVTRRDPASPGVTGLEPDVRAQLARILKSGTFEQADRLKRFLTFIVTEAIAGRRVRAEGVRDRRAGVPARRHLRIRAPTRSCACRRARLRAKLVRYYREEGRADQFVVELPKGGYAPVFKRRDAPCWRAHGQLGARQPQHRRGARLSPITAVAHDLDYFCRGVRDELIHHLARIAACASSPCAPSPPRTSVRARRGGHRHRRQRAAGRPTGCASTSS